MEIFNKILHSYAMYCRKEMVKNLKCYLIPKKSLSKGAIFFGQPCRMHVTVSFTGELSTKSLTGYKT